VRGNSQRTPPAMRNFGASATTMRSRDVAPIAEWPRQVTRCPRPPPACSGGPHSSSGRKGRSLAASCRACQPPSALDLPARTCRGRQEAPGRGRIRLLGGRPDVPGDDLEVVAEGFGGRHLRRAQRVEVVPAGRIVQAIQGDRVAVGLVDVATRPSGRAASRSSTAPRASIPPGTRPPPCKP